jgi:hypothetical protein
MTGVSCCSGKQAEFGAEMNIHFSGLEGLNKPSVMVFPKLTVCFECGSAQFALPETELHILAEGVTA